MPYNMYQYTDEVMARMSRYDVQIELDPLKLEMLINRARMDVQAATMPIFRERYGRIAIIGSSPALVPTYSHGSIATYQVNLPTDLIEDEVVLVKYDSNDWAARKLDKREFYGVIRNSWSYPTPQAPIYMVEKDPANPLATIYVSKGSASVIANDITIWYLAALPYLQSYPVSGVPDNERKMGWQWEELVVLCTMVKAYEMLQFNQMRDLISNDVQTMVSLMEEQYKTTIDRSKLLLPTRESVVPGVPISDVPLGGN